MMTFLEILELMMLRWTILLVSCLAIVQETTAAEPSVTPVTIENFVSPEANDKDEPLAKMFSLETATHFLDSAALDWQESRKCFTCHTNFAFLYARPLISATAPAHLEIRRSAEALVEQRWPEKGPRWDAEVIATAAALAFNDAATTGKLHPTTRTALDRMWAIQREDGGWDWLKCDWPPMESDDHYGATLAAIAVGVAPEGYAKSENARKGIAKLRSYLKNEPRPTLHHEAMLLWASTLLEGLLSREEQQEIASKLFALQKDDGGWALATLGDWKRADETDQDREHSDGYGTGFTLYVLRMSGLSADDPRLVKGINWLKKNQRESGRWFTRSLHKDSRHYISHAGTAFAVMALQVCRPEAK